MNDTLAIKEIKAHNLSRGFTAMRYHILDSTNGGTVAKTTLNKSQNGCFIPWEINTVPTQRDWQCPRTGLDSLQQPPGIQL